MIENITHRSLARFVLPSVLLMVFIAAYSAVDSLFIARFAGPAALAGLNIVLPLYSIAFACGIMFASGGGALIAVSLGRGEVENASSNMSSLLFVGAGFGTAAGILCIVFRGQLVTALGASGTAVPHAMIYGLFMMLTFPFMIVKVVTENLLRVAGVPSRALVMTLTGGGINILLDWFFMGPLEMGIAGAGLGTLLGIALSLPLGLSHFLSEGSGLRLVAALPDFRFLCRTVANGFSEMVNEAAIALTTFVFNILALRYMGQDGLAALAVVMGLNFLNLSVVFGFTTGISPLISYNYGRGRTEEVNKLIRCSFVFIAAASVLFFLLNFAGAEVFAGLYLSEGAACTLAAEGLRLYSFSFLFAGIDLFGSAFFTALGNGRISALISVLKSFIFFAIAASVLPVLMGAEGIWLIRPVVQAAVIFPVFYYMKKYQPEYNYRLPEWTRNNRFSAAGK